jgi:hypothetical protein
MLRYNSRFFTPTLVLLKYKSSEFTNTIFSLNDNKLKIDRTQYIGFDLDGMVPQFQQLSMNNKKEEVPEKDTHVISIPPVASPTINLKLYEKYRDILFTNVEGQAKIIGYFDVPSKSISWNQNAILFLLLVEKELNNQNYVDSNEYLKALDEVNIPSANWQSNITKFFKNSKNSSGTELSYISQDIQRDKEEYLDGLTDYIMKALTSFGRFLEKCGDKNYIKSISNIQVLCTLSLILSSGQLDINVNKIYETLATKDITNKNFLSTLSSAPTKPFFLYSKEERKVYLRPYKKLFEILESNKNLFKQYLPSKKQFPRMKISSGTGEEKSETKNITITNPRYVLNGRGAVIVNSKEQRVFIFAPKSIIGSSSDKRRNIILYGLAAFREIGVNEVSYRGITQILDDNRMGKLAIPRDLDRKNTFFSHDGENKTFSSIQSDESKELISELTNYQISKNDISQKMMELLPVFKKFIDGNQRTYIGKKEFKERCNEENLIVNLPRDIPQIFGFFYGNNFYPSPFLEIALKIKNTNSR